MIKNGLFFFCALSFQLMAAELPPAATPGGALPREGFKYPQPFSYPQAAPAPEVEQKIEQVEKGAPRMRIRGFKINGVKAHEEIGITQASVEQEVKQMAEEMVQGVAARGFTISMLEALTNRIARFYRSKGYFLARAYIPEQTVKDGIVQINIVEGFLDQIVYQGNRLYRKEQLQKVLEPLVGRSIYQPDVEQALFTLNDYPGLDARMIFGPGLKPGSAAVQLELTEQPSLDEISFDNFGSLYTGENRWKYFHQSNNLLGQADRLQTNVILTTSPANSRYLNASYQQPVINASLLAGGAVSLNSFDVGGNLSDLGIHGESRNLQGFMQYVLRRDRRQTISVRGGVNLKSSISKVRSTLDSEDRLTVLYGEASYAGVSWSSSGAYQSARIKLSLGLPDVLGAMDRNGSGKSGRAGGSGKLAGGNFSKLEFSYTRQQPLQPLQTLLLSFRGQYSPDLLTSMEQFSLGGPDSVRAYPVAEALMDTAWVFSAEWMAEASPDIAQTLLNRLRLSLFFDYASGSQNDPLQNEVESVRFSGAGGSAEMEPYKALKLKLTVAAATGDSASDNRSWPFYLSLNYRF